MSIRPNIATNFIPGHDQAYTYEELLHLRAAGKTIPEQWLTQAQAREAEAAADKKTQTQINKDTATAKTKYDADLAEKRSPVITELREAKARLEQQRTRRNELRAAYMSARSEFRASADKARDTLTKMNDTAKESFWDDPTDEVKFDNMGHLILDGESIKTDV